MVVSVLLTYGKRAEVPLLGLPLKLKGAKEPQIRICVCGNCRFFLILRKDLGHRHVSIHKNMFFISLGFVDSIRREKGACGHCNDEEK